MINWSTSWRVWVAAFVVGSLVQWIVFGFTEPTTDDAAFEPLVFIYQAMYLPFTVIACAVTIVLTVGTKRRHKPITAVSIALATVTLAVLACALPFGLSIGGVMASSSEATSFVGDIFTAETSREAASVLAGIGLPFSLGFVAFWTFASSRLTERRLTDS